jgi:hypothetical protein
MFQVKPWKLPEGTKIPLDGPFRASDVGLTGPHIHRLKNEGFIRSVGTTKSKYSRSKINLWIATEKLKEAMR